MDLKDSEATLLFLFMACSYALNYPILKIAFTMEPPLVVLFYRILFALVSSFPFLVFKLKEFPVRHGDNVVVLLVSMLNIVGFMGLWFIGESMVSASLSSILVYTYPLFNVLLSVIFIREKPGKGTIAGMIIGFIGVIMVASANVYLNGYLGVVLLIVSALSWAAGTAVFKKKTAHIDVRTINVLQYAYSLPVILVLTYVVGGSPFSGLTPEFIGVGLYLGLVGTYVPYLIYLILFRNYSISKISPYFFIIPAISVVFSSILLGERISLLTASGFAVISFGVFLSNR
ncbi:MAG: DMT family transporter [Candidatus Thermoplasmatota archaeon]|jgi:drug/metabolite transporter (DMT)-like permease|nr:DMT family transporter [Candidatus Thermoplasmatota archaeon]